MVIFPQLRSRPSSRLLSLSLSLSIHPLHLSTLSAPERNLSVPDLVFLFQTRFRQGSGAAEHVLTTSAQGISHLLFSLITARERGREQEREREPLFRHIYGFQIVRSLTLSKQPAVTCRYFTKFPN